MTGQERDYEAILSRVLHTTTDQLEPVGDGLTKIRERLSEPWLKRQWWLLRSELMVLRWFVVVRCESFLSKIRSRSDVTDLAPDESSGQQSADAPLQSLLSMATSVSGRNKKQQRSVGPAMAWLRPAFAVAGAVVLVVAGVFALGNIQQGFGFIGLGSDSGTNQPATSGQTGPNGSTQGGGKTFPASRSPSQGRSGSASPGTSAAHSKTAPSPGPCQSAAPPPVSSPSPTSASPTPTPTSSPTSSPTASPTASPTTSTSQAPMTSGIAGHSPQEAIGTTALVLCGPTASASPSPSNQAP
jgi:hypothetical protein